MAGWGLGSLAHLIAELEAMLTGAARVARTFIGALRARPRREQVSSTYALDPEEAELPASYGMTHLVMLAVDPYTVYAYWEVTSEKLTSARSQIREEQRAAQAVLRFHSASHDGSSVNQNVGYFDIEIDLKARNWYVPLWTPSVRYEVELGLRGQNGGFVVLAGSNLVQTPRAKPESVVDERFMRVSRPEPRVEIVPPPAYLKPGPAKVPTPPAYPKPGPAEVPPPAAETTLPAAVVPLDSAEVLRKKLFAIYGVREWLHQPRKREGAPDLDLTEIAEKSLSPGFSSASLRPPEH